MNEEFFPDMHQIFEKSESNHPAVFLWLKSSTGTTYLVFRGSHGTGESLSDILSGRTEVGLNEVKVVCHGGIPIQFK